MHTQEHFASTVKAVAAAAVASGLAVAAISGATPEFLTSYYIDHIVAAVMAVASVYYALKVKAPAEPFA